MSGTGPVGAAPVALLTPVNDSGAVELAANSRLFRKEVLRSGSINYKGRKLDFSPGYLDNLVRTFGENPYPLVPLMFSADGKHTRDIDRVRGEVIGLERTPTGVDAVIRASNDTSAALLRDNPKLGCSVRIENNVEREADGKSWPFAMQHLLVVDDPHLPGLGDWAPVEMAATDDREVIDLSRHTFAEHGETADPPDTQEESQMALTDEDVDRIASALATKFNPPAPAAGAPGTPAPPAEGVEDGWEMPSDDELTQIAASLFDDDELAEFQAALSGGETAETAPEPVEVTMARERRDHDHDEALELANQRIDEQAIELRRWQRRAEAADWNAERDTLVGEGGIPLDVVNAARPLLEGSGYTVELARGGQADAGEVMRDVLKRMAGHLKFVDLSRGETAYEDGGEDDDRKASRDRMADYVAENNL